MDKKQLPKAPIREAIIDLQVELPKDTKADRLKVLSDKIKDTYPKISERRALQGTFELKDGKPAGGTKDLGVNGYLSVSNDGQRIAQFRQDGFTFNRLKPYLDWADFNGEARRLWDIYSSELHPRIKRVGVRFINVLELPLPINNLSEYLNCLPGFPLAETGAWFVSGYLSSVEIIDPTRNYAARITHARQPSANPSVAVIHLDIDVYKAEPFGTRYDDAWKVIESFREIKNNIFFGLITPVTEAMYK